MQPYQLRRRFLLRNFNDLSNTGKRKRFRKAFVLNCIEMKMAVQSPKSGSKIVNGTKKPNQAFRLVARARQEFLAWGFAER